MTPAAPYVKNFPNHFRGGKYVTDAPVQRKAQDVASNRSGRFIRHRIVPALTGLSSLAVVIAFAAPPASAATAASGQAAAASAAVKSAAVKPVAATPAAVKPVAPKPAAATPSAASPASAQSIPAALAGVYEAGRHLPASSVSGVRPGTLHTAESGGYEWAIASFDPAKSAASKTVADFQDSAAGVFEETHGTWHLVRSGLYGCADGLPAALKTAWHISGPASVCAASASAQAVAAQAALAALPARARAVAAKATSVKPASASPASAKATSAKPASAAASAGDTDPADIGQTIASVALSQVGVSDTPDVTSFNGVDCDPYSTLVAGFSANSDGCGYDTTFGVTNENETWCSDFSKWVWEQAGVNTDMNTLNAGSVSFYDWAQAQGETPKADTGTPEPGDAIVFFNPYSYPGYADHVGIVTGVNSDGTVNMANGDFLAAAGIHVEYDTDLSLTSWAASVWGAGEEWFIVTPPATAQNPAPTGTLSAPAVAVTGTTGSFQASGTVPGASISSYYWTFGDGRVTNTTGADVTHTFSEAGTYTVTVTMTASTGAVATLVRDVKVLDPSSAVASAPSDAIWYNSTPVDQYVFTRSGGGLAADSWDGGGWLQFAVPGDVAPTGEIAALAYPDTADADAMTPHAYYRTATGSLAETYLSTSGWVTQDLPGTPAAGSAIVATTTVAGYPAVFFANGRHQLAETAQTSAGWATKTLLAAPVYSPGSLVLTDTTSGPVLFAEGPGGLVTATSPLGSLWLTLPVPALARPGGSLAALTTPDGSAGVFFTTAGGKLAEATRDTASQWDVAVLPGSPAGRGGLAATTYLLPSAGSGSVAVSGAPATTLGQEAFYLTAAGAPAVTYYDGSSWHSAALPADSGATGIAGASGYQAGAQPSEVYLTDGSGDLSEEISAGTNGDPSASWTSLTLPLVPATWADQVVLYAADSADATAAQAAAAAAGLPASQVVTSFATAWADTLSGEYLVIAVGGPAVGALYSNACGWANPSGLPAGSTPFFYYLGPLNTLPGADAYVNAAGATAAGTQALATDLAYYALNGALPPGVSSLPAAVGPPAGCVGSPS